MKKTLFTFTALLLIVSMAACSAPAPAVTASQEVLSSAAPTVEPTVAPTAEPVVKPKEGELLFAGHSKNSGVGDIKCSFILSADKTYIHDVTIKITNLNASAGSGDSKTKIKVASATEHFAGPYPVQYGKYTDEFSVGANTISNLCFNEELAPFLLVYNYLYSGTDGTQTEIGCGVFDFKLSIQDPSTYDSSQAEDELAALRDPAETIFAETLLRNWDEQALQSAYGISDIRAFTPSSPIPKYYIVCADMVIDPVTKRESEGGYNSASARHKPISTQDMIETSGNLLFGGLILTDDPNKATYALLLHYSYENEIGTFHFSDDDSTIPQYNASLDAELLNLTSGESIFSERLFDYATTVGESVRKEMLDAAKGKQLYGASILLSEENFSDYWSFINN
jgi:hypothetical protein